MKGIVIAGTCSGSGKTTITLGLMAALKRKGFRVAPFKIGPDFIDPGHHTRITGIESRNLDGWMLSKAYNQESFARHTAGADIAIVEGVMGLFDGYDGKSESGSTAQMAKWLGLPVMLVVNARSMARSAAALVSGFERFDPDLTFAGVLFNNIGTPRHIAYLQDALHGNVAMPCLGGIPRNEILAIPERHLGLFTTDDHPLSKEYIDQLANIVEENVDIQALLQTLPEISESQTSSKEISHKSRVRIGIARDNAFCFYYPDNLEILETAGAELIFFSPLNDDKLPDNISGLYFGGGYPELFAQKLSENQNLRADIKKKSDAGMPIYGECGGFMYLCKEIIDTDGNHYPMTGCFPFISKMQNRLSSLGYREITLAKKTLLGNPGEIIRGHEFHYSTTDTDTEIVDAVYHVSDRLGIPKKEEGYQIHQTLGSYIHLHFGSNQLAAKHFIDACAAF